MKIGKAIKRKENRRRREEKWRWKREEEKESGRPKDSVKCRNKQEGMKKKIKKNDEKQEKDI